jgi:2,3-bisphosphoglycerate-dependent phosphoglycerate mutase
MKKSSFLSRFFTLMGVVLLLSNFSAIAQKTTVWIVNHAENDDNNDQLSAQGQQRAIDLEKMLKHDNIQVIYITGRKVSAQTANPLAAKAKVLPRVYTDSVQQFAEIIKRNFAGKNILIVASYNSILPLLSAFGAQSPFDALDEGDYDQLYKVTIKSNGTVDFAVAYYGKKHHTNAIPQSYILDNFTPGIPGH